MLLRSAMMVLFLGSLSSVGALAQEKLVTPDLPVSDTETWEQLGNDSLLNPSRLWQRKDRGFNDSFAITIGMATLRPLYKHRKQQDDPGREACESFTSKRIKSGKNGSYPSLLWRTRCEKSDGSIAVMLHGMIDGDAHFYHLQKIWLDPVEPEELDLWMRLFKESYVCDESGRNAKACPADLPS